MGVGVGVFVGLGVGFADVAGGGDGAPNVGVTAGAVVGEGDGDGEGEGVGEAEVEVAWSETCCVAAAGWLRWTGTVALVRRVAASAVPAATTTITTAATKATLIILERRPSQIRSTVKPPTAGGSPDGHSAASSSAASPRCDRPRSSQSGPYSPTAAAWSAATNEVAVGGPPLGFLGHARLDQRPQRLGHRLQRHRLDLVLAHQHLGGVPDERRHARSGTHRTSR